MKRVIPATQNRVKTNSSPRSGRAALPGRRLAHWALIWVAVLVTATPVLAGPTGPPQGDVTSRPYPAQPLPLSAFPRPPADNGLGVHWSTYLYGQSADATEFFVTELTRMNVKWVKLLNDGTTGRHYDDTIDRLQDAGIMPVLRLYSECNEPYDPTELEALVRHYVPKGVYYYELYNEPDGPGRTSGWCSPHSEPDPKYLAAIWQAAARVVYRAGGYPSLPSFFAPSQKLADWQDDFFYRFFEALRNQGNESVLYLLGRGAQLHHQPPSHLSLRRCESDRPTADGG